MLPDLRVLFFATVSTFLVAICAAFFVSLHVLPDSLTVAQPDRATPINRVATSWQDVSRPTMRDLSPVVLRPNGVISPPARPDDASDEADAPTPNESIAGKTPDATATPDNSKDTVPEVPAITGAIGDVPPLPPIPPASEKLAARPDPAEAAVQKPATAPAIPPAAAPKAKVDPRTARKRRSARRDVYGAPLNSSATNPGYNFFTEFGSYSH
jgi:hypothetical protein